MSSVTTIAFDAMGSDLGPKEIVRGVAQLSLEAPHICSLLVGDREQIDAELNELRHRTECIAVHHAPDFIAMDEHPREALSKKPQASIAVASRLVAEGEAHALVSAGNTGAGVLACAQSFKLLPGIRRAALAAVYPTQRLRGDNRDPFSLILDVGATVDASPEDLEAFAVMGAAYAKVVSKNPTPRVGLLSNGVEPMKGPPSVAEAHRLLLKRSEIQFIGNIEGIDIPQGKADVIVCDGFVGNICIKMLEGVRDTVAQLAQYAWKEKLLWRLGLAMLRSGIERLKDVTDWEQYGGAPVLGFDHVFIKAHGRANARTIANAGKVAAKAVRAQLGDLILDGLP
jgi:glycerol-3-phosphate acyltransferase PlsX